MRYQKYEMYNKIVRTSTIEWCYKESMLLLKLLLLFW
jgi:hypothetical protein